MKRLCALLPDLQRVLGIPTGGSPPIAASPTNVGALVRAMRRKAIFAEMHMAVLAGIEWDRVDGLGRRSQGSSAPDHLSVRLSDASLVVEHPGAAIDHVYLAFDGLTAAVVNMTDTLGRLVNSAYSLKIEPRRASLLSVRDACTITSALGIVLHDPANTDWLRRVREMRGRCQHADVEEVLTSGAGPYAQRGQPFVDAAYCWSIPAHPQPVLDYAQAAIAAAEGCLLAATTAILSAPKNPTS